MSANVYVSNFDPGFTAPKPHQGLLRIALESRFKIISIFTMEFNSRYYSFEGPMMGQIQAS